MCCVDLDSRTAKRSVSAEKIADNKSANTLKKVSELDQNKRYIVITKCLCEPCPKFYTDTIFKSVLIECKDPRHSTGIS